MIPAYNEAAGIAATIRSMVTSRYRGRIEVIVVDDGSTDAPQPSPATCASPMSA